MKKRQNILWISLLVLAAALLASCNMGASSELIPNPTPLPDPVDIKLDLQFDRADDLAWLGLMYMDDKPGKEIQIEDGMLHLTADQRVLAFDLKYQLEPGYVLHYRTRVSAAGPCNEIKVSGLAFGGCVDGLYDFSASRDLDEYGSGYHGELPVHGSVPALGDVWVDRIVWLNPAGDAMYYVITNTDSPEFVMYGSVAIPEESQDDRIGVWLDSYFEFDSPKASGQYHDIDFIRMVRGSLESYLFYHVPAYLENEEEMDAFLAEPPSPMPELQYFDNSPEE